MIKLARGSLGVPFVQYGRDLKKGIDCVGLLTVPAQANGADLPILDGLSRVPQIRNAHQIGEVVAKEMQRINSSEARAGDVLLFDIWSPLRGLIEHCALITEDWPLVIIHATPGPVPGVISHRLDARMVESLPTTWEHFVAGVYRFK